MTDKTRRSPTRAKAVSRPRAAGSKRTTADTVAVQAKDPDQKRRAQRPAQSRDQGPLVKIPAKAKKAAGPGKVAQPGKAAVTTPAGKPKRTAAEVVKTAQAVRSAKAKRSRSPKGKSGVALARFSVGDVVRHKFYPFRGVIFDIDPVFANSDDWWLSIPEQMRPRKNQPFYHLLAENAETEYIAYVSEQNLLPDTTGVPVRHPQVSEYFVEDEDGRYRPVFMGMLN